MSNIYKIYHNNENHWLDNIASQLDIEIVDNRLILPPDIGKVLLTEFHVEDGMDVTYGELELNHQLEFISRPSRSKNSLSIIFKYIERGHSFFKPFEGEYKEVKSGGVHFLSSNVFSHLIFPENTHSFFFRVNISMGWIRDNLSAFICQNETFKSLIFGREKIMHFEPLTNLFMRLIRDVFKSEFDTKLAPLIVKDKGFEALVLFFDHFYKQFFNQDIKISKYSIEDQKKLYILIDSIKDNLHKKLSLNHLSREVGFSKSKLQSLFHYFFHQSIYAYIKNSKLEKAVVVLLKTDKDIRYIAHYLGYNSSTHFINIFRKHYGISPKKYRMKNLSFYKSKGKRVQ